MGRMQRYLKRYAFPARVAEYALECGMSVWGVNIVIYAIFDHTASRSLQILPGEVQFAWTFSMALASLTTIVGIFIRPRNATIASGMYLFGASLIAYGIAIVGAAGWRTGGAIAGFLLINGTVCCLRGWWLNDREVALERELSRRKNRKG
jgi:hypothetical protein